MTPICALCGGAFTKGSHSAQARLAGPSARKRQARCEQGISPRVAGTRLEDSIARKRQAHCAQAHVNRNQKALFENPNRAVQSYELKGNPAERFYNRGERELPPGSQIEVEYHGYAVALLPGFAQQARRTYARFAWAKDAPDHVNPAAPGDAENRLYQFLAKISLGPGMYPEYKTSVSGRLAGRSSGARRKEWGQPKQFACSGDPFELVAAQGKSAPQLSVRSWRPTDELTWLKTKPYSYWGAADYDLSIDCWSRFPTLSSDSLQPRYIPRENTELVMTFPESFATARQVARYLSNRDQPAPPPATSSSSSWCMGDPKATWPPAPPPKAKGKKETTTANEEPGPQPENRLAVFTGEEMNSFVVAD